MTFSPSNEYLASSSSDGNVIIWDVSVGCCHSPLHTLQPRHGAIWSIAFSPDGHSLASASTDGSVALWCVDGGSRLSTLTGHEGAISSVAWAPDGARLASASADTTCRVWDVSDGGSDSRQLWRLGGLGGAPYYVAWHGSSTSQLLQYVISMLLMITISRRAVLRGMGSQGTSAGGGVFVWQCWGVVQAADNPQI